MMVTSDSGPVLLRRTPYELVFGPAQFESVIFPRIADEAESRDATDGGPEAFMMLGTVGNLLRGLRPDAAGESGDTGPPAEAIRQYGALAWHAFRFWQAGRPAYAFAAGVVRTLLGDTEPPGDWRFRAPAEAGYIQLPRHLLWTHVEEGGPAEPIDGFHWTWLDAGATSGRAVPRLDVLLCVGLRPGRAGLSVIEITAEPPGGDGHWGDIDGREDGADFGNVLPGGELQDYHGIVSVAEVLKLVSRCFRWIDGRPESVLESGAGRTARAGETEVWASRLDFRAVVPGSGDGT